MMKKPIKKIRMKRIAPIFAILIVFIAMALAVNVSIAASGSIILQESVASDQALRRVQGMPVIISKKMNHVSISPKSIIIKPREPVIFTLVIANPQSSPLQFSMNDITIHAQENVLTPLDPDTITAEAREDLLKNDYKLNKEQKKEFAAYIEETLNRLKEKLLTSQAIEAKGQAMGDIYVRVPSGTKKVTVEIRLQKETHTFEFNVIES